MESGEEEKSHSNHRVQWLATFAVFLMNMQLGISIGWSSPNVARLISGESPIQITASQVSWLLALPTVAAAVGSILGSVFMNYFGSRKTALLTNILMDISWGCLLVSNSVELLFVSRIIFGITGSTAHCCFSIFLAEISEPKLRGTLIAIGLVGTAIGMTIGLVCETYLPMRITSSMYLVACLIGTFIFISLKDTPFHLMKRGDSESAEKSLLFYKPDCCKKTELAEIKNFVQVEDKQGCSEKFEELKKPAVRRSILLVVLLFSLAHFTGMGVVMSYTETILKAAKFDLINPAETVIYINVIFVTAACMAVPFIDRLGRRFILIFSSIGAIIAMIALGIHFQLESSGFDVERLQWLPICSILFLMLTAPIGSSTVPSTVLSETFTENMKSIGGLAASLSTSLVGFATVKMYQPVIDSVGASYAYWMFAVLTALCLPIVLYLLPETKGKTFQEIQEELRK